MDKQQTEQFLGLLQELVEELRGTRADLKEIAAHLPKMPKVPAFFGTKKG